MNWISGVDYRSLIWTYELNHITKLSIAEYLLCDSILNLFYSRYSILPVKNLVCFTGGLSNLRWFCLKKIGIKQAPSPKAVPLPK